MRRRYLVTYGNGGSGKRFRHLDKALQSAFVQSAPWRSLTWRVYDVLLMTEVAVFRHGERVS